MKTRYFKFAAAVLCVLAAGICYSCGGAAGRGGAEGRTLVLGEGAGSPGEEENGVGNAGAGGDTGTGGAGGYGTGAGAGEAGTFPDTPGGDLPVCYVHVCGEVRNPGVYRLEAGSRIFQAVDAAGGFTEEAAVSYLNLAGEIADGMQIVVPSESEAETMERVPSGISGTAEAASQPAGSGGKVDLNTADKELFMTLRGIGEAKAEDIIRYREEHGPFRTIEEIMNVSGIKKAAFEKIRDDITVSSP